MSKVVEGIKGVMIFNPQDTAEETNAKWQRWLRETEPSAVGDRNIPGVEETLEILREMG